jgi:hypothetical protein
MYAQNLGGASILVWNPGLLASENGSIPMLASRLRRHFSRFLCFSDLNLHYLSISLILSTFGALKFKLYLK